MTTQAPEPTEVDGPWGDLFAAVDAGPHPAPVLGTVAGPPNPTTTTPGEPMTAQHEADVLAEVVLPDLTEATEALEGVVVRMTAKAKGDDLGVEFLATSTAILVDLRKRIASVEADLATALGRAVGKGKGYLPDGRQYEVTRSPDRKSWDHSEWARDARRVITNKILDRYVGLDVREFADRETGEAVTGGRLIQEALLEIEAVHGSTAPRSRALTALGLYASDYCESSPGGWRFAVLPPKPAATDTTTTKD